MNIPDYTCVCRGDKWKESQITHFWLRTIKNASNEVFDSLWLLVLSGHTCSLKASAITVRVNILLTLPAFWYSSKICLRVPVVHCTVLCYTVLYYTVLYCTVLYCNVLYCTVPVLLVPAGVGVGGVHQAAVLVLSVSHACNSSLVLYTLLLKVSISRFNF